MGRIKPLKPPTKTSRAAGAVPMVTNTASDTAMKITVAMLRLRSVISMKATRKLTEV